MNIHCSMRMLPKIRWWQFREAFSMSQQGLQVAAIYPYCWVVRGGYRRVFFQYLKYKKNTKKIQPKNTKSELQGLENTTGWFCIFFVFWFLISKSEHGVGSLAYFWNCLFFVFCFWNLGFVFFCILYFWNCWFVYFLYFVFLSNCIRIFFVFFVFFHYVQKCNLYFCIFFVFFQSFTDCTLSFLYFLRSLDMPSKNKTANPSMYVVFSFCW